MICLRGRADPNAAIKNMYLFFNIAFAQSRCLINGREVPCEQVFSGLASGFWTIVIGFLATVIFFTILGAIISKSRHSRELDKVLDTGEKIMWEGKPVFWPFFISSLSGSLIGWVVAGFFGFFTIISVLGFIFAIAIPLYTLLVYKFTYYAITHKRVIMQSGVIGRDFKIVDFDKITNAEVHVNLLDKLFAKNAGTVVVATAGAPISYSQGRRGGGRVKWPYSLLHIKDPYKVFKMLKEVGHAVKTDIQYPNQYRPQSNPGYQTEYKSKDQQQPPPQPPQQ